MASVMHTEAKQTIEADGRLGGARGGDTGGAGSNGVFTTRSMCDLNAYQVFTKVVKLYFEKYFTYEP